MTEANSSHAAEAPASSHWYVTYFDKNYLAKGLTLITSLQEHDPGCRVDVVCLDKETRQALLRLNMPGVRPVDIALIEKNDPELNKVKGERPLVEYYWSLTPAVVLRLLEDMPQGEVLTYVDADLYFLASPQPIFDEMEKADVLIHGHNFSDDLQYLEKFGLYNVGLMCFRASEEGFKVLRWWRKKCPEWCGNYIDEDPEGGTRFGDQKYLERFANISSAVRVCGHPGVGVAPWNHTKFPLTRNPAGQLCVAGQPVIMYHYHSFAVLAPCCALPSTKAYPLTPEIVQFFHIPYLEAWEKAHQRIREVMPNFSSGFAPQALTPELCVLARAEQAHTFADCGLTESVPLQNSLGEPYRLFVAPQLRRPGAKNHSDTRRPPSLEASLATYRRFTQKPRLLNLGCGSHSHAAWLNVDIAPSIAGVHAVDLRGDWPLPENFFDVVYHSHVLEHMSEAQGAAYLRKCFAALKPGGVLRVAVPDLEAIARNYLAALDGARQGTTGAEQRHTWMLLELIDQMARHHSGGGMAEYFKQVPLPEKDFVLARIGREGEQLANALQGKTPCTAEDSDPLSVGKFRLGGEVHRWMYDPWSLRRALEIAGFTDITQMDAVTSAWPDFASFNLDANSAGLVRKPVSFFMEARKPVVKAEDFTLHLPLATASSECRIRETPLQNKVFWNGSYNTWQSAVEAASGYDTEKIFTTVRNAARAVRDGLALWERDSVLFHTRQYNMPIVESLLNIAKQNQGQLHVLDFGGALGSTYQQNKNAFKILAECTWHVVEQTHFVECGQAEFSDSHLTFYHTMDEALRSAPINVILFSSVLQYVEEPYGVLRQAVKTGLPIIIDRTTILSTQEYITVQHVPEAIYKASYPYRWLNLRTIKAIFAQHGYKLASWWQSDVDPEGFIGTVAHKVPHAKHKKEPSAVETTAPLRVMQADSFYSAYLTQFYQNSSHLAQADYKTQTESLFRGGFSAIHALAPYLANIGCVTDYSISNCLPLQKSWAQEHHIPFSQDAATWEKDMLRQRVAWFKPDVLYIADPILFDAQFLASLSFQPRCIVAWRAADIPFGIDWTGYDIMLSGLPRLLALAESLGVKKGVMFQPGMPPWIARAVETIPQDTDVVFVGSISPSQHVHRLALLDTIAQAATQYGFSFAAHLLCNPGCLTPALRPFVRPPVFGLEMHKALRRGRIVIDDRAYHGLVMPDGSKKLNLGGDDTSNMRLFEGTGGGSLVLTEALPGVARYFEPGTEIATYTSHSHAVEQIVYFLQHEEECTRLAKAGQKRCLGEWNIMNCVKQFMDIVRSALA